MKTSLAFIYRLPKVMGMAALLLVFSGFAPVPSTREMPEAPAKDQTIMLALLLDTSNSMDGLIDQAKSQLWKIVNELSAAKCTDGTRPQIRIALYEYGNDGLAAREGYIRQVNPLTDDLDVISEKLFALTTNGGSEFCGHVIQTSLHQLAWSESKADLKMIFIAGNEPFTQGGISYRVACALAKEKDVVVNTIFCGGFDEGIGTNWKSGADLTGGSYMSIEQNRKTVYIATPYDEQIEAMNTKLNGTYVYYGSTGAEKKRLQLAQDDNAGSYGKANTVERAVSKSSHAYRNAGWDLVDAAREDAKVITEAKEEELPKEMRGMNAQQRTAYVKQKSAERIKIQAAIQTLNQKRQAYITSHTAQESNDASLDEAMIKAVKQQAGSKSLTWK
ncbi:MAG: hypothetical protein DI538_05355 [Azospira oryzae]|jgi:hypothetical protein|nr:MAG: hypothetical protein DI538_05355 [Azospira oryzae]